MSKRKTSSQVEMFGIKEKFKELSDRLITREQFLEYCESIGLNMQELRNFYWRQGYDTSEKILSPSKPAAIKEPF